MNVTTEITPQQVIEKLRGLIRFDYKQADLARDAGVSETMVSKVLNEQATPSDALLAKIGVRKVVTVHYYEDGKP